VGEEGARSIVDARRIVRRFALVLFVLLALTIGAAQATASGTTPSGGERSQTLDQAILEGLNSVRAEHGLRPLVLSGALQQAAAFQSRAMLTEGFFAHDAPNGPRFSTRLKRFYAPVAGKGGWSAGENLLYTSGTLDADQAIDAWMGSAGHRKNMLDPGWREVGIASMRSANAGGVFGSGPTWVVTMDFGVRPGAAQAKRTTASKPA
jgi:uncharacterized protein YkwD